MKPELPKTRKKKSFQATDRIYGEINKGMSKDTLKNPRNTTFVLLSKNPVIVPSNVEKRATKKASRALFPNNRSIFLSRNPKLSFSEPSVKKTDSNVQAIGSTIRRANER